MKTNNALNQPNSLSNGQIYIGNSGNSVIANTITAGTNIIVTNGPGTITISSALVEGFDTFLLASNNLSDVASPSSSASNLFTITNVNSSVSLPSTAYGTEVVCLGSSSFAVQLPDPATGVDKFIDFSCQTDANITVSIIAFASETVVGQTAIYLGQGDGIRLISDGTNWWAMNIYLAQNSFLATMSATATIPTDVLTVIPFDTINSQIGTGYDNSSYTFTPSLPGVYNLYYSSATNLVNGTTNTATWQIYSTATPIATAQVVFPLANSYVSSYRSVYEYSSTGITARAYTATFLQTTGINVGLSPDFSYFGARRVSLF